MPISGLPDILWRPDVDISLFRGDGKDIYEPEFFETIDTAIETLSDELRALSLDIHGKRAVRGL